LGAERQRVAVAYPHPQELSARFTHSLIPMLCRDAAGAQRIELIANSSGANITNARNEACEAFLDRLPGYDWLCFIDTDMVFDGRQGRADATLIDRLVKSAHPTKRPILGALCFSWQEGQYAAPTLYVLRGDGKVGRLLDYPRRQLVEVDATGAGCLLIHRSVLEKMRAERTWAAAYPWFQETNIGDLPVGEDVTFCVRARSLGFPIFVDTSIVVGHEKTVIVDENVFEAQQAARVLEPPAEPTIAVIPTLGNRPQWLTPLAHTLEQSATVLIYSGDEPIHRKWNLGLDEAEKQARAAGHDRWNVLIVNDDIEIDGTFATRLARGLRADENIWIAYPNHHGLDLADGEYVQTASDALAGQTMSGWAFMVRGEAGLRFDEQFEFWYGDSDLERQVREAGKLTVCVGGCYANHLQPMESSKSRRAVIDRDEARFAEKWGIDPSTLWLAQHPEFGR